MRWKVMPISFYDTSPNLFYPRRSSQQDISWFSMYFVWVWMCHYMFQCLTVSQPDSWARLVRTLFLPTNSPSHSVLQRTNGFWIWLANLGRGSPEISPFTTMIHSNRHRFLGGSILPCFMFLVSTFEHCATRRSITWSTNRGRPRS